MERVKRVGLETESAGGTEGGRSPTRVPPAAPLPVGVSGDNGRDRQSGGLKGREAPDPEVLERPVRRRFPAEYKARILSEADACTEPGDLGSLLRREGLYSSHLVLWRRQREAGILTGLTPKRRGRKTRKDPLAEENARLQRENARLREKLRQAELILEVQKKASEILGIPLKTAENGEDD